MKPKTEEKEIKNFMDNGVDQGFVAANGQVMNSDLFQNLIKKLCEDYNNDQTKIKIR